jgi:hypothetical protein
MHSVRWQAGRTIVEAHFVEFIGGDDETVGESNAHRACGRTYD